MGCDLSSSSTVWVSSSYVAAARAVLLLLQTQLRMSCASCLTDRKITSNGIHIHSLSGLIKLSKGVLSSAQLWTIKQIWMKRSQRWQIL
jgi:hypothetical protein